jgi:hypothetical protein
MSQKEAGEVMQAAPDLTRPDTLLVEFGGKICVSVLPATFNIERECQDLTAKLDCACGASAEFRMPSDGEPVAFRYFNSPVDVPGHQYVAVVRAGQAEPMCDHWIELPLALKL